MDVAAEVNKESTLEDVEAAVSADAGEPKDADVEAEEAEEAEQERLRREREARAQALTLEIVGDLPYAEVKPPENVLFVCKLNPVTEDEDLNLIFSRFGPIVSCEVIRDKRTGDSLQYAFIEYENQKDCEQAYFKMPGVLIDDHRIHVDFSQSVSRVADAWRTKTNAKRQQQGGGFGGVAELERKRQYRKMEPKEDEQDVSNGYNMVFDKKQLPTDRHDRHVPKSGNRRRSRSPPYRDSYRRATPPREERRRRSRSKSWEGWRDDKGSRKRHRSRDYPRDHSDQQRRRPKGREDSRERYDDRRMKR